MFCFCLSPLLSVVLGSCGQRPESLCISTRTADPSLQARQLTARVTGTFR